MPKLLIALGCLLAGYWILASTPASPVPKARVSDATVTASSVRFVDETLLSGIRFHHLQRSETLAGVDETLGAGACVVDINGDGWMDILLVGARGQSHHYGRSHRWLRSPGNTLYLNSGEGYFVDATAAAGLDTTDDGMGCVAADFDNDSDADILLTGYRGLRLWQNEGGRLADITVAAGISDSRWSTGAAIADVNGDGWLDVFVASYLAHDRRYRPFEAHSGFQAATPATFRADLYDGTNNTLWINHGNWQFTSEATVRGITDASGRSLGGAWIDHDEDGCPDLLVLNDVGSANRLYRNDCRGHFSSVASNPRSLSDGGRAAVLLRLGNAPSSALLMTRPAGDGSVLLHARHDHAWETGINTARSLPHERWGMAVADFDGNGLDDIYLAQGLRMPDLDRATLPQGQADTLLLQEIGHDGASFVEVPSGGAHASRSALRADFDNDGRPDVLVTRNNGPPALLMNRSDGIHNWIGLVIEPDSRRISGGRLTITARGQQMVHSLRHEAAFLGSHDPRLLITLPADTPSADVEIVDPDGQSQTYAHLQSGRYHALAEDGTHRPLDTGLWDLQLTAAEQSFLSGDRATRTSFARLLAQSRETRAVRLLDKLLDGDSPLAADLVLELVDTPVVQLLPLYLKWLQNADPQRVTAGILALERLEDDVSVTALLPLLNHADTTLACRTARVFRHLFREEEATIDRKWLAVPQLLKLMEHAHRDRKLCFLDALAEAEHVRSAVALPSLLNTDDTELQAALIRVLGRTRQRTAFPFLTELLAKTENGNVAAECLVALRRLAAPDVDVQWRAFVARVSPGAQAQALVRLHSSDGGSVFQPGWLHAEADALLAGVAWRSTPPSDLPVLLQLARLAQFALPKSQLMAWFNHSFPEVRLQALLTSAYQQRSLEVLPIALHDADPAVREGFLADPVARGLSVPSAVADQLLREAATRSLWPELLPNIPPAARARAVRRALTYTSESDSWYRQLADGCRVHSVDTTLTMDWFAQSQGAYRDAGIACGLGATFSNLSEKERSALLRKLVPAKEDALYRWLAQGQDRAIRRQVTTLLYRLIETTSAAEAERLFIVQLPYDRGYDAYVIQRFPQMPSAQKQAVLAALTEATLTEPLRALVQRVADNPTEAAATRLWAALILARQHNDVTRRSAGV